MKRERGITLIALIITIIILIILAAITITTLSNFDIINMASKAAENYKSEEERELAMFKELGSKYGNISSGNISIDTSGVSHEELASLEERIAKLEAKPYFTAPDYTNNNGQNQVPLNAFQGCRDIFTAPADGYVYIRLVLAVSNTKDVFLFARINGNNGHYDVAAVGSSNGRLADIGTTVPISKNDVLKAVTGSNAVTGIFYYRFIPLKS